MARDKGQIYEASDWFKEALQINQVLWFVAWKSATSLSHETLFICQLNSGFSRFLKIPEIWTKNSFRLWKVQKLVDIGHEESTDF